MNMETLLEAHRAEPFRVFTIRMADGRQVPVYHREFLALDPTGRAAAVYQPTGAMTVIELALAKQLEFGPTIANSQPTSDR